MRKEERSIFCGSLSTIEGVVAIAKGFYVDVEWICRDIKAKVGVVAISGRLPEMIHFKNALPRIRKEGNVYTL